MTVTRMADYRVRNTAADETVAVLTHLLDCAQRGEMQDAAIYASVNGREQIVFTGGYRNDPGAAARAIVRMSGRLAQLEDDLEEIQPCNGC